MAGDAIQRLLSQAEAEIGYLEKASNADLDDKTANAGDGNYTKYARDLDKVSFFNGKKQHVAWCAVFVSWLFWKQFGKSTALAMLCQPSSNNAAAGCNSARNYYKKKGRLYDAPQVGDQIFFWSSTDPTSAGHTGVVVKISSNRVYTIEGNTTGASSVVANGGGVCKKNYTLGYGRIAGYGRPDWSLVENQDNGGEQNMSYTAKVIAKSGKTVNMRKTADDNAKIVCKVPIGSIVYTEGTTGKWTKCNYEAPNYIYTGYMQTQFLQEVPGENPATSDGAGGEYVTVRRDELLRAYEILGQILYANGRAGDDGDGPAAG